MFSSAPASFTPDGEQEQHLKLRRLDTHGLGVWTAPARTAGDIVDRFTGRISTEIDQHSLQITDGFHISDTRFVGYLSHSCDPNCRLDMSAFTLVARRDIAPGELLTIDYAATEDRLFAQFACACGSASCRRWITGRAEAVNAQGAAYLRGDGAP